MPAGLDKRFINLGIHRTRAGAIRMTGELLTELKRLRNLKRSKYFSDMPIRMITWLLNEPAIIRSMEKLGFTKEKGVKYFDGFDVNLLWHEDIETYSATLKEFTNNVPALLNTGLESVNWSKNNLIEFLLKGRLPLIGAAIIPQDVFFESNSVVK